MYSTYNILCTIMIICCLELSIVFEWGKCIKNVALQLSPLPHQLFLNMLYFTVNVSNKLIATLCCIHSLPAQAASLPRSQSAPTQASKAYKSAAPSSGNRGVSGVAGSCPGDIQGSATSLTRDTRGSVTSLTRMDEELNNWSSDDYDEIDPTTRQRRDYEYNSEFQV